MRILFIYPNSANYTRVPMGLATLITCAKKAGHEIRLFDTSFYRFTDRTDDDIRENLGQVKKTNLSEYGVVIEKKPKQEIFDRLNDLIDSFSPSLCAFSVTEEMVGQAYELAREIKKKHDIPVIFGGIGVTTAPEEMIVNPFIDMICVGEGEDALIELANTMDSGRDYSGIRNLWVKKDGRIIKNELRPLKDVDTLPFLDLDDFSDKHFFRPLLGKIYRMVLFYRIHGCPFQCNYCSNHVLQNLYANKGKYVRIKSVRRAIDELVYLRDRYKINMVNFIDDDVCLQSEEDLGEFLDAYKKEVRVPFLVQARANTVSEKKLKDLKKAGCVLVCMSIESGSEMIREKIMNRRIPNEVLVGAFQLAKRIGLKANSTNIIGNPDETRKEVFETIEINRRCEPYNISTNFMIPYKGTQIRKLCVERGYLDPEFSVRSGVRSDPVLNMPQIAREELLGIQKVFSLYAKLPRILHPIIRFCEKDSWLSDRIYGSLLALMWMLNR